MLSYLWIGVSYFMFFYLYVCVYSYLCINIFHMKLRIESYNVYLKLQKIFVFSCNLHFFSLIFKLTPSFFLFITSRHHCHCFKFAFIFGCICSVSLSSCQEQPKIIEPLDYEAVVFQRKAQIHSDPHRDLLLCPVDDVSVSLLLHLFPTLPSGPVVAHCYTMNPHGTAGNSDPNMTFHLNVTHVYV